MRRAGPTPRQKPITKAEYARQIGVTPQYVNKLIKAGKVPVTVDGQIDPVEADAWRLAHRDPARRHLVKARLAEIERDDPTSAVTDYHKARTARMAFAAKLAQLEFDRARSALIDKQETLAVVYALFRATRDKLLALPRRTVPLCVGKPRAQQEEIWSREIHAALEQLTEGELLGALE